MSTLPRDQPNPAPLRRGVPTVYRAATAPPGAATDEDPLIPWPLPRMRDRRPTVVPPGVKRRRVRPPAGTRHPLPGLFGLLVFAMLGGFFGWVSADPAWLAIGHGRQATATVAECTGQGIGRKCMATLAGPALPAAAVRVVGAQVKTGQRVPVQVVNASSTVAYAGPGGALVLRAVLGLVLVLACGAGTAWATGAARLPYRVLTVPASAAVPLLLALGLLAAAF